MADLKILLTISPVFWPKLPPLGLGYLQSFLADNGIKADILDLNNLFYNLADAQLKKEWLVSCNLALEEKIHTLIRKDYPRQYRQCLEAMLGYDLIGFSCFKSNLKTTLEITRELRARKKKIRIVLGGPEITRQLFKGRGRINPMIAGSADLLVAGEGERPFYDYSRRKKNKNKIVSFRQLDEPGLSGFPRYPGLDLGLYPEKNALPLLFSRGCVRRCDFCSERLLYRGFRSRKVESVIEEIRYHRENNKISRFIFFDSMINGDPARLEDLCDKIIANFGSINWEAQIAVRGDMDEGIFDKIKKSGCYNLFIGLESGSDKTLKRMNKGFSPAQAGDFFRKLNKAGLFFGISLIAGYPGEAESDFREGMDFIIANKDIIPKIEQVNPFTYYEGTKADKRGDYKLNKTALERAQILVSRIKQEGFKYTNAFLGNLIEKDGRI